MNKPKEMQVEKIYLYDIYGTPEGTFSFFYIREKKL